MCNKIFQSKIGSSANSVENWDATFGPFFNVSQGYYPKSATKKEPLARDANLDLYLIFCILDTDPIPKMFKQRSVTVLYLPRTMFLSPN